MKRSLVWAAAAGTILANPLPSELGENAADPPSGIGTGVTIAIAPKGGRPKGCYPTWNGPAFGIAAVPVQVRRDVEIAGAVSAEKPPPSFTLAASAADSAADILDLGLPAVTGAPVHRLLDGYARAAANETDSDVTVTSYSTRTRTRTVTVKQSGSKASSAAETTPTALDLKGKTTIRAAQLYQIGDGQVQAAASPSPIALIPATSAKGGAAPTPFAPLPKNAPKISQIGDGQIQAPTAAATALPKNNSKDSGANKPASPAPVAKPAPAAQPPVALNLPSAQAPPAAAAPAPQVLDLPAAAPPAAPAMEGHAGHMKRQNGQGRMGGYGCRNKDGSTLEQTLKNGLLLDNKGRTGYIADNRQFQFDAPPQAGAQITAGWSVCDDGFLALGPSKTFYQCLSGSFYNIYDDKVNAAVATQCKPINLILLENKEC